MVQTLEQLRNQIATEIDERRSWRRSDATEAQQRSKIVEVERQKILDAYYANAIDVEMLKTEQDRIGAQIRGSEGSTGAGSHEELDDWQETIDLAMKLASNCARAYKKASTHERRPLNQTIFKRIDIRNEKIVEVSYSETFGNLFWSWF